MYYVPAGVSGTDGVNTSISSSVCGVGGIKAKMNKSMLKAIFI